MWPAPVTPEVAKAPVDSGDGGAGGDAYARSGGTAVGGHGGRPGHLGGGAGGKGGGARSGLQHESDHVSQSFGGGGGDGGRLDRPVLGGYHSPETVEAIRSFCGSLDRMSDRYGIIQPGVGGCGGNFDIKVAGSAYSMVTLLRLVSLTNPRAISWTDQRVYAGPDAYWRALRRRFPATAAKAIEHYDRSERARELEQKIPCDPHHCRCKPSIRARAAAVLAFFMR